MCSFMIRLNTLINQANLTGQFLELFRTPLRIGWYLVEIIYDTTNQNSLQDFLKDVKPLYAIGRGILRALKPEFFSSAVKAPNNAPGQFEEFRKFKCLWLAY